MQTTLRMSPSRIVVSALATSAVAGALVLARQGTDAKQTSNSALATPTDASPATAVVEDPPSPCDWFRTVRMPELATFRVVGAPGEEDAADASPPLLKELPDGCDEGARESLATLLEYNHCMDTAHGAWALELRELEFDDSPELCDLRRWSADVYAVKLEAADAGPPHREAVRLQLWPMQPAEGENRPARKDRVWSGNGTRDGEMEIDELRIQDTYGDEDVIRVHAHRGSYPCNCGTGDNTTPDPTESLSFHLGIKNGKPRWVAPPKPKHDAAAH